MRNLPAPDLQPEFYAYVSAKRLGAWLIDTVLILLLCLVAILATALVGAFFLPLIYLATNIAYRTVALARWSATPGMMILAVEFRGADGHRLDARTALMHTVIYTVCFLAFPLQIVSIALMLTSQRGQSLGDHLLQTVALNRPARG